MQRRFQALPALPLPTSAVLAAVLVSGGCSEGKGGVVLAGVSGIPSLASTVTLATPGAAATREALPAQARESEPAVESAVEPGPESEPGAAPRAAQIAALIEAREFDAAEALLGPWLAEDASNAGLHLAELSLRLATWSFVPYHADIDHATPLLARARTVAQLDPTLAPAIADALLSQVERDLRAHAADHTTLMALAEWIYPAKPGAAPKFRHAQGLLVGPKDVASLSAERAPRTRGAALAASDLPFAAMAMRSAYGSLFVGGGWMHLVDGAFALDPTCAARWGTRLRALPELFVVEGMYTSALLAIDAEGRLTSGFDYASRALDILDAARRHTSRDTNRGHRLAVALLTYFDRSPAPVVRHWRAQDPRLAGVIETLDRTLAPADARAVRGELGLR